MRIVACLILLGSSACGSSPSNDAGVDAAGPIGLTVTHATTAMVLDNAVGGIPFVPRPGNEYMVLDVTVEARSVGPIPVAPNAFVLFLSDNSQLNADPMSTEGTTNGCASRSVPLGMSASCKAVFQATIGATPDHLQWSDGTRTVTAPTGPLS